MAQKALPSSPVLRLKRAESELRNGMQQVLGSEGISFEYWQVLAALLERPGIRMTDLAELASLPPATLTRHVDQLVERALIIRRMDVDDKRRVVVALSRRGEQLALRVHEVERVVSAELGALLQTQQSTPSPQDGQESQISA